MGEICGIYKNLQLPQRIYQNPLNVTILANDISMSKIMQIMKPTGIFLIGPHHDGPSHDEDTRVQQSGTCHRPFAHFDFKIF